MGHLVLARTDIIFINATYLYRALQMFFLQNQIHLHRYTVFGTDNAIQLFSMIFKIFAKQFPVDIAVYCKGVQIIHIWHDAFFLYGKRMFLHALIEASFPFNKG